MGSLMAGWNSNPGNFKLQRNKSMTKEEIDAFWRQKRQVQQEHLREVGEVAAPAAAAVSPSSSPEIVQEGAKFLTPDEKEALKNFDAWWTRSNWAFLNEPPVKAMEGPSYKYAAQYHVANKA